MTLYTINEFRNLKRDAKQKWFDDSILSVDDSYFVLEFELKSPEEVEITFDDGKNWQKLIPTPQPPGN